ncbi:MAG: hypothetical protein QNJ51_10895 [Calothrix sp. MO_167.B12]|nr:hypothetical protein [Calothrix sp. MO_167.B12]
MDLRSQQNMFDNFWVSMYDRKIAKALAGSDIPAFACSPDKFPDLMAAAISGRDLGEWKSEVW